MTNLLNCGCKSTPQEMLPNHEPTQKHPSPSVGKLQPNKSLYSTSQAQRAIISPTTGVSAMVPPATLCEETSLQEGGCLFPFFFSLHFFNLEGFVHIPRLTPLQYARGASTADLQWAGTFTKTICRPDTAMRKHSFFLCSILSLVLLLSGCRWLTNFWEWWKRNIIHHLTSCWTLKQEHLSFWNLI